MTQSQANPETEVIRPRHIQLIPGWYAALLVHRRRVLFQELEGTIEARNELAACQDVVAWLRAACSARGGGGAQNATPSVVHAFIPLNLPPEAYRYDMAKVQADLPALVSRGGVTDSTNLAVAGGALLQALALREPWMARLGEVPSRPK